MINYEANLMNICLNFPDYIDQIINIDGLFQSHELIDMVNCIKEYKEKHEDYKLLKDYIIDSNLLSVYLECNENIPIESSFSYYLERALESKFRRDIIGFALNLNEDKRDFFDLRESFKGILDNTEINHGNEIQKASDLCPKILEDMEYKRIMSFIDIIDDEQLGYEPNDLVIIGARPSIGKTSLILDLIRKHLKNDQKVGFVSCEMKTRRIMELLACCGAGINFNSIVNKTISKTDFQRYLNALDRLYYKEFYLDGSMFFEDIVRNIKTMIKKNKVDLIYIDHLHHILTHREFGTEREKLAFITIVLKSIAKEYDVPIILAAQLNRGAESAENKKPAIKDVKGCGDVEQIADVMILIHRISNEIQGDKSRRLYDIIVGKNRNGAIGEMRKIFYPQTRRWENGKIL